MQEAFDFLRLKADSGGESTLAPLTVGSDQLSDVTPIEAVVKALWTRHTQSQGARAGRERQSRRSAACAECE